MRALSKILFLLVAMLAAGIRLAAQTPVVGIDYNKTTYIAPAYFGPNCFQVPYMLDGRGSNDLKVELAGDYIYGRTGSKDDTYDIYLRVQVPLFTDRVSLNVWWAVHEWYNMSPDVLAFRRVPPGTKGRGNAAGPIFVSTDILVMRETERRPGLSLRAAMRTAAEDNAYENARGYDAPGYFFDLAAGKSWGGFRLSASVGFLCWQTDYGRQNDAVMFGLQAAYTHQFFDLSAHYGAYWGWERAGDFPNTLRLRCDVGDAAKWYVRPYVEYQHGFKDWPFDLFRVGVSYSLDLVSRWKNR